MKLIDKLINRRLSLVLIGVLPIIIFAVSMILVFTAQQSGAMKRLMLSATSSSAHIVEQAIGEQIGLIQGLIISRYLDSGDLENFRIDAQKLWKMHPEWRTLIITDSEKQVMNLKGPVAPLRDPESLKQVWMAKKPFVGNFAYGNVALRMPVMRDGEIRYTIVVPIKPDFFKEILNRSEEQKKWGFIITGSDNVVIASSDDSGVKPGTALSKPLQGKPSEPFLHQGKLYSSPESINYGRWRILIFAPVESVEVPFLKVRLIVYTAGALAAVLTAVLVLLLSASWSDKQEALRLRNEIEERKAAQAALLNSRRWQHIALEAAGAGTWEWNLETGENIWSDELWPLYGLEQGSVEPSYDAWESTICPEDRLKTIVTIQHASEKGLPFETEWRINSEGAKDGGREEKWLMARGLPVLDSDGKVIRYLGLVMDVTARKRAEAELHISEENYRITIDSIGDAVLVTDRDGRITHMNPVAEKLTGWSINEGLGESIEKIFNIINEYSRNSVQNPVTKILNEGRIVGLANHTLLISKDGGETPIADSGAPIRSMDGKISGVVLVFRDQTEEREYQRQIKESERRFRLLVENAPDAIFVQTEGNFEYVNSAAVKLFGAKSAELLLGKPILDRCHPDEREIIADRIKRLNQNREAVPRRVTICLRLDGSQIHVDVSAVPFEYRSKPGSLVFMRDISEIILSERRKKELEEQLNQAQKMESIGRLAGGVAHDFNNMLSVITGYSEMALESASSDDDLQSSLGEILTAAKRSSDITRQLLAFARQQTIAPRVLDLNDTVESMLKMLRRLIGENIELEWYPVEGVWPVKMDPSQIDQILANLCVNSRDAISDVGRITIRTDMQSLESAFCDKNLVCVTGDFVLLQIKDNGCGMDKETMEKIFEPFFTTKGIGRGTGLGLATVYGIVKQNDGFIDVESRPGEGSTFTIYFPRYSGTDIKPGKINIEGVPKGKGELILVVEDEPLILRLVNRMLTNLGYSVITAKTPAEALSLVEDHEKEISLLITDVVMPEMNGRELAERFKSIYPGLKVLFMSGYTADVIANRGILEEGVNFIQKPFAAKDIAVKIKSALS